MGFARNAGSPPSVNYLIGKKIKEEPAGETDPFFSALGVGHCGRATNPAARVSCERAEVGDDVKSVFAPLLVLLLSAASALYRLASYDKTVPLPTMMTGRVPSACTW